MCYSDGEPIGKSRMILDEETGSFEVYRRIMTNEKSSDSVVLTKDTRVKGGLPIDGDQ